MVSVSYAQEPITVPATLIVGRAPLVRWTHPGGHLSDLGLECAWYASAAGAPALEGAGLRSRAGDPAPPMGAAVCRVDSPARRLGERLSLLQVNSHLPRRCGPRVHRWHLEKVVYEIAGEDAMPQMFQAVVLGSEGGKGIS